MKITATVLIIYKRLNSNLNLNMSIEIVLRPLTSQGHLRRSSDKPSRLKSVTSGKENRFATNVSIDYNSTVTTATTTSKASTSQVKAKILRSSVKKLPARDTKLMARVALKVALIRQGATNEILTKVLKQLEEVIDSKLVGQGHIFNLLEEQGISKLRDFM